MICCQQRKSRRVNCKEEALMGHHSCCNKQKMRRGLWSPEEDEKLIKYVTTHGHGCWSSVPKQAGLQRCGKSCRLRWINYLRPDLKRGCFSIQEERLIIELHKILGNRWAQIAKHLPGRTDNEVKNFWNSCIKKKLLAQGMDLNTHQLINQPNSIKDFRSIENSINGQGVVNGMGGHVPGSNNPMLNSDLREIVSGSCLPSAENVDVSSYALLPDMISKDWPYEYQISIARNNTSFESKYIQAEPASAPSMPSSNIKDFRRLEPKQFSAQYNFTDVGQIGIDHMTIPIYEIAINHQLATPTVAQIDCGLNPSCPPQLPKLCEMEHAAEDRCSSDIKGANDIQLFSVSANCESYEHFDIDLFDSSVMVSECINHPATEWS